MDASQGPSETHQPEILEEKEFSLIQELARDSARTQRDLSRSTGLSLGMTNILLQRLVRKGYVKVRQLDWKRTQYLLTVRGVMEKTRKSYAYTLHIIRQFHAIRKSLHEVVLAEYHRGLRSAVVVAWPETAEAIRQALGELDLPGLELRYVETFEEAAGSPGVVFAATVEPAPEPGSGQRFVPLLENGELKFRFDG